MSERNAPENTGSHGAGAGGAIGAIVGAIAGSALLYLLFGERVDAGATGLGLPTLGMAATAVIGAVLLAAIGGASSGRAGFLVGLLLPAAFFVIPAFALKSETADGTSASIGDGDGSMNADPEAPGGGAPPATIDLETQLRLREVELDAARRLAAAAENTATTEVDNAARILAALEEERRKSANLEKSIEAQRGMLTGSDEAVLRARKELDEALQRLADTQAKYGLERSNLLEKIESLEEPAATFKAKVRTLEAAGYHPCGIVMNVEKSRYGDRLAIRTSVDADRIGGEGILRAPDGTIIAVIEFVIGRDETLSAKVLFTKKAARVTVGDVVYSRLR